MNELTCAAIRVGGGDWNIFAQSFHMICSHDSRVEVREMELGAQKVSRGTVDSSRGVVKAEAAY